MELGRGRARTSADLVISDERVREHSLRMSLKVVYLANRHRLVLRR